MQLLPLQLSLPLAAFGHTPTPVIPETHLDPFDRPASFPLPSDTSAATLGRPLSKLPVSHDLGIEPEVRAELVEALEDPNALVVGPQST